MYNLQVKKKGTSVIECIEIPQDVVKWIQLIVVSNDSRINLTKHKSEIMDYLDAYSTDGSALVRRVLKKYDKVELIRH
jgi:hypothetical protein